ncbi:hypothetical protein Alches_19790 [Alicyclobacillus hesperidum subsp. aegles]|nr:hypothetical protein [Alicyclobacillus hesperidum]GLG01938.1 hypothetical protein Alches_19790 [Alicyclobacillus hesperidum subsp. aegles]
MDEDTPKFVIEQTVQRVEARELPSDPQVAGNLAAAAERPREEEEA